MPDRKDRDARAKSRAGPSAGDGPSAEDTAEAERRLGRYTAIGIPVAALVGAVVVAMMLSLGPAILVLLAGALLGTIALFWASLRTLSGDAPLPLELEMMAARTGKVDELAEKKRRVLLALKDLEHEHAVGKIDDKDYGTLSARFREEAKNLMREMDESIEPLRERAEELARKHLAAKGLHPRNTADVEEEPERRPARIQCPKCDTSNEPDASFCKKCGTTLRSEEANAEG
jgi:hypothetical protein